MTRYLLLVIIFSVNQLANAQEKFLLSKDANPIVYANIYSKDFGTVSNEEGLFETSRFNDRDSITISHVGYRGLTISKEKLVLTDTIYLEYDEIVLNEVVVQGFSARDTLFKAVSKVPDNYFPEAYNSLGFYRHHLVEDDIGVEMVETYLLSYHPEHGNNESSQAKILSGKSTKNYSKFGLYAVGGVVNIINRADFVRNEQNILNTDNAVKYQFNLDGIIDKNIYVISFKAKDSVDLATNRFGKIYVQSNSLAILEVNMSRDRVKLARLNDGMPKPDKDTPSFNKVDIQTTIKYRKGENDKYILSFVHGVNHLKGIYRGDSKIYKLNVKYIVTDIKTKNVEKIISNYDQEIPFIFQDKHMSSNEFWYNNSSEFIFSDKERNILRDIENQNQ